MPVSSFARPKARSSLFSFKMVLLVALLASVIYLMLVPLPEPQKEHYHITKIEVVAHPVVQKDLSAPQGSA